MRAQIACIKSSSSLGVLLSFYCMSLCVFSVLFFKSWCSVIHGMHKYTSQNLEGVLEQVPFLMVRLEWCEFFQRCQTASCSADTGVLTYLWVHSIWVYKQRHAWCQLQLCFPVNTWLFNLHDAWIKQKLWDIHHLVSDPIKL